jgi:hypothetical protein
MNKGILFVSTCEYFSIHTIASSIQFIANLEHNKNLFIKNLTVNQLLQLGKKGLNYLYQNKQHHRERERERERELMKEYSINQFTLKQTNKKHESVTTTSTTAPTRQLAAS